MESRFRIGIEREAIGALATLHALTLHAPPKQPELGIYFCTSPYLEEFPDYITQGESLEDLREHLRDLYADLSGGHIPAVRRVADLEVT